MESGSEPGLYGCMYSLATRTSCRGRKDETHMGLKELVGSSTRGVCLRAFPHVLREMEKNVGKQ